ncbi:hypothetical protein [Phenylobacterium hankyongense]|uniref:hypothetical protein n=1 Tax=Phenylobacterium hankyongense TaxID=1813876 RepID=UPI0010577216|nr:hypothetical protein [Phenylobacterium hankyongense]
MAAVVGRIIGQSGGHGSQGWEAATAGAPPITSMIAASRARRRLSFSIIAKMTMADGEGKTPAGALLDVVAARTFAKRVGREAT